MAYRRPLQLHHVLSRVGFNGTSTLSALPQGKSQSPCSSSSSQDLINSEYEYSAHNLLTTKGSSIWDPEGKRYLDFLSAYSAVNQGHCHPTIMKALQEQAERLTLSSRAFYNDRFPLFAKLLTDMFGYDMVLPMNTGAEGVLPMNTGAEGVLPMNTGAEGVETALKLARKWGYEKKKIPKDEAIIVSCCECFHGRTLAVISMSCDNEATRGFGPLLLGHLKVDSVIQQPLRKFLKKMEIG